jgi:hypothetical protein
MIPAALSDLSPGQRPDAATSIEECRSVADAFAHLAANTSDDFERAIMIQIADRLRRLANHKNKERPQRKALPHRRRPRPLSGKKKRGSSASAE